MRGEDHLAKQKVFDKIKALYRGVVGADFRGKGISFLAQVKNMAKAGIADF